MAEDFNHLGYLLQEQILLASELWLASKELCVMCKWGLVCIVFVVVRANQVNPRAKSLSKMEVWQSLDLSINDQTETHLVSQHQQDLKAPRVGHRRLQEPLRKTPLDATTFYVRINGLVRLKCHLRQVRF